MANDVPAYSEETWVPDSAPGISAAQLQRVDDQVKALTDEFNQHNGGLAISDHPEAAAGRGFQSAADKSVTDAHGGVVLRKSGVQAISHDSVVALIWQVEDIDDWSGHATNAAEILDETAGMYVVSCMVEWDSDSTGIRQCHIVTTGGRSIAFDRQDALFSEGNVLSCAGVIDLDGSDEVKIEVLQKSGGSLNVLATERTKFQIARVGLR